MPSPAEPTGGCAPVVFSLDARAAIATAIKRQGPDADPFIEALEEFATTFRDAELLTAADRPERARMSKVADLARRLDTSLQALECNDDGTDRLHDGLQAQGYSPSFVRELRGRLEILMGAAEFGSSDNAGPGPGRPAETARTWLVLHIEEAMHRFGLSSTLYEYGAWATVCRVVLAELGQPVPGRIMRVLTEARAQIAAPVIPPTAQQQ